MSLPTISPLRGLVEVTRLLRAREDLPALLDAVARTIGESLGYRTVAVNVYRPEWDDFEVTTVYGNEDARAMLLGNSRPGEDWTVLLSDRFERLGAYVVPAGSVDWDSLGPSYLPQGGRACHPDAWDPEDALFVPMRDHRGLLLGIVSVDEPLSGRRPTDDEVRVLMAVADQAALALEHVLVTAGSGGQAPSGEAPELRLAAAMLLAETLDLRDAGTAEHSRTVGQFARDTAAALGLAAARVDRLQAAGVLHDLGKLGIADAILHKPGALDDAEWREMTRHPEIGARILEHAGLRDIAAWVLAHHERLDGRGYPSGLAADEIPLEARVLAVADAYEAMVADRPYRTGLPPETARAELERCAGSQFDPDVVAAFLRVLDRRVAPPAPAAS